MSDDYDKKTFDEMSDEPFDESSDEPFDETFDKDENEYRSFYETLYEDENQLRAPDKNFNDVLLNPYDEAYENSIYENNSMNEQLKIALEISINEYENKLKEDYLKISNRKKSLELFSKKIKFLNFISEEIEIKNFIEKVLDDYFNLKIDFVNIDKDNYEKIYKIIDSYYLIPTQKNYKKTAISFEEDQIIRNIFREYISL